MLASLILSLIVTLTTQAPTTPAQPASPSTPADCVKAARAFAVKRQQEMRPLTSDIVRQIDREKTAMAKTCAAQFDIKTTAESDLASLAQLYSEAGQPDLAKE